MSLDPGAIPASLILPLRVRVQGIEAVLITADAYDAFSRTSQRSVGTLSRVERDPELRAFIDERMATHEMTVIREEAVKLFGEDRVPSSSALGRYAVAQRRAAQAVTRRARRRRVPRGSG